jgi:O-antigen ligase
MVPGLLNRLGRLLSDDEVTSLHGRTEVWSIAMNAFRSNPLWGYGPTLFTDPAAPAHGLYDHAHSQLHQSLGTAGLVGAVGLLVFVIALLVTAVRTARATAGLSISLVAITLTTCVAEAPLRGLGFSPYLVLVLVDVGILLVYVRSLEETAVSTAGLPATRRPHAPAHRVAPGLHR